MIDEYQHVPDLLNAIKAELNRDLGPGRFVLAGSTRYTTLPEAGQALTGRVDILEVLPLTQAEIDGATGDLMISKLLDGADLSLGSRALHDDTRRVRPPDHFRWDAGRVATAAGALPIALVRELPRSCY